MEWIGVIGIFIALVFFVVSAMRGYNVMITAPITAVIIILANGMDMATSMLVDPSQSYMAGLASFVKNNMLIFLFSAILGKYIDASGAAKTIAHAIMKKIGKGNAFYVMIGVALVGAILTYGGVSMFVAMFALIPLARVLFKETNIPWHLFAAAWSLGATSFTMAMIPGTPSIANVVASNMTGVTMTSAPILGIVASVIVIVLGLWYMKWALNKALAKGEVYDCEDVAEVAPADEKLPGLGISVLPLVVLILVIIIGSSFKVDHIVYIGMVVAVVLAAVLFNKYIKSQRDVLGEGAKDSLGPVLFTSAAVGVGSVIAASAGFIIIQEAIFNMPGGPLVSSATLAGILGGLTGSGSGALGIIANNFIDPYLATGVDPAALYKVMAIAATTGGALPNSGAMFGMIAAMGLTHKTAYKHIFAICIVISFIALVVVIGLASLGIA